MINRRSFLATVATLTGSVAFGVATRKSDEDWLIGCEDAEKLGVPVDDLNEYGDPKYHDVGFSTYREGNLNLIIAKSASFHDRWMKAHRHCVIERPRDRKRRIKIFRHYLYGEPA